MHMHIIFLRMLPQWVIRKKPNPTHTKPESNPTNPHLSWVGFLIPKPNPTHTIPTCNQNWSWWCLFFNWKFVYYEIINWIFLNFWKKRKYNINKCIAFLIKINASFFIMIDQKQFFDFVVFNEFVCQKDFFINSIFEKFSLTWFFDFSNFIKIFVACFFEIVKIKIQIITFVEFFINCHRFFQCN